MLSPKSLKKITKVCGLALSGLALGILGASLVSHQTTPSPRVRSMASVGGVRPVRLPLGKQAAALSIELSGPSTIPESSEEVLELTGTITQHIEGDGGVISYIWSLPPGVELVRGPLSSTMSEITLGQPRQVSILVKGFSRARQKLVSLSCQVHKAGQELTASAVIVSRPEDTAEAIVMDLGAQAKAAAAAEEDASQKQ